MIDRWTPARTLRRLEIIPGLAAEVFLTWGAKNPTDAPLITPRRIDPPAPADLEALSCLRVDDRGLLFRLSQCVRATAEEIRDQGAKWPELVTPPTWVGECSWLLATESTWAPDDYLGGEDGLVTTEVKIIHDDLRRAARVMPVPVLPCLVEGCQGVIRPKGQDGAEWLWPEECEDGHFIDRRELARRALDCQPMTIQELAGRIRKPVGTVKHWAAMGWIKPVTNGRPARYAATDAIRLANVIKPGPRRVS